MGSRFLDRWAALRTSVLGGGAARRIARGMEDIESTGAGTVGITGALAATLGGLAALAVGTVGITGSMTASLAGLTSTGAGDVEAPTSVTFTMPPANYDESDATTRTMGRVGGHLALHYFLLGTSHYVWFRQGTASPDPGADLGSGAALVAALAGRTGIRVDLPASSQTDVQTATATAAAIDAVIGLAASSAGADVTVTTGATTASAGTGTFAARGREGIIGTPDNRAMTLNSFASASLRCLLLDTSDWDDEPIVVTGFGLGIGDTHNDGVVIALWQGGSGDNDFDGATPLGVVGVTAGDAVTGQTVYVQSEGVYVDPSLGRVWVSVCHDVGAAELSFTWYNQASQEGNNYTLTGNNAIHLMTSGVESSDPADLPSTLGTRASSELGMLALQLTFVEAANFQSNMAPTFDFGTQAGVTAGERDQTFTFADTTGAELVVGNSYNVPSHMRGLELLRFAVNYATHSSGSDYCGHIGIGGAAVDDWSGASIYEVGQTTGTATGWNYVDAPSGIPLTESTRIWLLIEFDGSGSELAFDGGASNIFEDDHWGPAAWYNGNTSESEYAPLSNPIVSEGEQSTNLDYDPGSAGLQAANTGSGPWTVTPNGLNFQNDNNVGVHGTAVTVGWAVA